MVHVLLLFAYGVFLLIFSALFYLGMHWLGGAHPFDACLGTALGTLGGMCLHGIKIMTRVQRMEKSDYPREKLLSDNIVQLSGMIVAMSWMGTAWYVLGTEGAPPRFQELKQPPVADLLVGQSSAPSFERQTP